MTAPTPPDGTQFFRGLIFGLILSAPFWFCVFLLFALP